MDNVLDRVVADPAFGTKTKLAEFLGISVAAVSQWSEIPAHHVGRIEQATEHRITCHEMRPTLFAKPAALDKDAKANIEAAE